ncbi:endoplasmic reticulum mannosyl-oligosaccharide 1,2-alpha-mannosidase isoform X1 [Anopheles arabiensis]|uniref:alpha-1,2-Mannosidase n=2 Tax=gambiae species complex TaxID=44542 RepID=A0A182I8J8_ANOAR|nr:endoplasmic reticulum mannosyl-oligosaccharide 1,2-alpha-mannosidase isoform X2 [Anopheles gambiae]XP_040154545.1 endoplasmic reticulum mannosyl-oligosaccharide 1,2-alpha-mannosidase isoform X1 [Anopheles arabiensis]
MDAKIEHVSVILPVSNDPLIVGNVSSRKSLKRHWNQLSRFQKNLACILLAGMCIFYVIFFVLPFNDPSRSSEVIDPMEHIQIAPFKERHERLASPVVKEIKLTDSLANPPTEEALAKPVAQQAEANLMQLEVVHQEPKEIVDNEENVLEENRRAPLAGAKDFKGPTNDRQRAVVDAVLHSWKGYKEYAWGHDNLKPISMGYSDWFGLGLTLVDSLDTLYIMDLQDEYDEARAWVEKYLKFDINREVNLFEVTIRVVGGLLSAYHLSGDRMFLDKAIDLGNRLLPCFDSPSGIPFSDVNIGSLAAHAPKWSPDSSTSEVTTIQLEFRDLSRASQNPVFEKVASRVNLKIHELDKNEGLVPIFINANTGQFRNFATVSLGARADSYYEYLLKQWLQTGKKADDYLIEDYQKSMRGVLNQLVRTTPNEKHVYIGELLNGKDFKPKMDHLTCYLPGTLLLGYKNGMPKTHLRLATDLLETCYQTYMKQPTQLAPEISYFNVNGESETDIYVKTNDAHNLLRPEFVESLYYFYAITGNRTYQDMGWTIFEAFNRYTKVKNGYTSIGNVKNPLNTRPRDMMESFWLGETLKYFYLLFSDDRNEIDLDKYVFNSEAHLLPIRDD